MLKFKQKAYPVRFPYRYDTYSMIMMQIGTGKPVRNLKCSPLFRLSQRPSNDDTRKQLRFSKFTFPRAWGRDEF